jgi:uncharacterized damage-inducible protein DinB
MERDDLIAQVGAVHGRTFEAAERLTDALVAWRPREGAFSAGELVVHIAHTRLMNVATIMGEPTRYRGHDVRAGEGRDWLLQLLLRTSKKTIAGLVGADFDAGVRTLSGATVPAWRILLNGLIEHEVHHRSQLCDYLSAAGVEPPALYGLHAEDLPRGD